MIPTKANFIEAALLVVVAGLNNSHEDARLSHGKSMNAAWQVPRSPIGSISLAG